MPPGEEYYTNVSKNKKLIQVHRDLAPNFRRSNMINNNDDEAVFKAARQQPVLSLALKDPTGKFKGAALNRTFREKLPKNFQPVRLDLSSPDATRDTYFTVGTLKDMSSLLATKLSTLCNTNAHEVLRVGVCSSLKRHDERDKNWYLELEDGTLAKKAQKFSGIDLLRRFGCHLVLLCVFSGASCDLYSRIVEMKVQEAMDRLDRHSNMGAYESGLSLFQLIEGERVSILYAFTIPEERFEIEQSVDTPGVYDVKLTDLEDNVWVALAAKTSKAQPLAVTGSLRRARAEEEQENEDEDDDQGQVARSDEDSDGDNENAGDEQEAEGCGDYDPRMSSDEDDDDYDSDSD